MAELFSVHPTLNLSMLHAGGAIGSVEFLEAMRDPKCRQGLGLLMAEAIYRVQDVALAGRIQEGSGLVKQ